MLQESLKRTSNLMSSGSYFPRRMINRIAERHPEAVRDAFRALFDEERDLMERVTSFQATLNNLTAASFPDKRSYQDDRAVMVYLTLHYPDTYYLYKWTMFGDFVRKLDHNYKPKLQTWVNVIPYLALCERVREEIILHDSLLKHHYERIGADEYPDKAFHMLTQDFIYAVTRYLTLTDEPTVPPQPRLRLTDVSVEPRVKTPVLKGSFTDYAARQQRRSRIGHRGEALVFQFERQKHGEMVIHKSLVEGDGLGYDILSVDDDGGDKYIEVKTTTGGPARSFFVTANELERSRLEGARYYLYRLFNFDEEKESADFYVLRGDLSAYCINPILYEVMVDVSGSESVGSF